MSFLLNTDFSNIDDFNKSFKPPLFNSFTESVEWCILLLDSPSTGSFVYKEQKSIIDFGFNGIKTFDGCVLIVDKNLKELDANYKLIEETVNLRDLEYFFNVKTFIINSSNPKEEYNKVALCKTRLVPQEELKKTAYLGKKIVELSFSVLKANEKFANTRFYLWVLPSAKGGIPDQVCVLFNLTQLRKFKDIRSIDGAATRSAEIIFNDYNSSTQLSFANYYQWFVYIKENPKSIGFKIPISPESSKETFALRETAEGDKRKKAIVNWVKEHYRNVKSESYSEEYRQTIVKQHLRGETKFNWRGLECHIIPAQYDINRTKTKKKFLTI